MTGLDGCIWDSTNYPADWYVMTTTCEWTKGYTLLYTGEECDSANAYTLEEHKIVVKARDCDYRCTIEKTQTCTFFSVHPRNGCKLYTGTCTTK